MPDHTLDADEYEQELLEAVRQQEGLETCAQAYEHLLRKRIREGNEKLTGRGRAIYEVKGERR